MDIIRELDSEDTARVRGQLCNAHLLRRRTRRAARLQPRRCSSADPALPADGRDGTYLRRSVGRRDDSRVLSADGCLFCFTGDGAPESRRTRIPASRHPPPSQYSPQSALREEDGAHQPSPVQHRKYSKRPRDQPAVFTSAGKNKPGGETQPLAQSSCAPAAASSPGCP